MTIDFSRLKNSQDIRIRPLITIHSHRTDKSVIYCGLGYSIEYYLEENHRDMYGLEIKVFGKMISAWIK